MICCSHSLLIDGGQRSHIITVRASVKINSNLKTVMRQTKCAAPGAHDHEKLAAISRPQSLRAPSASPRASRDAGGSRPPPRASNAPARSVSKTASISVTKRDGARPSHPGLVVPFYVLAPAGRCTPLRSRGRKVPTRTVPCCCWAARLYRVCTEVCTVGVRVCCTAVLYTAVVRSRTYPLNKPAV